MPPLLAGHRGRAAPVARPLPFLTGGRSADNVTRWGIVKANVVDRVKTTDDATLVVKFDKPYPESIVAPYMFTGRSGFVLDKVETLKHEVDGDHANKRLGSNTACVGGYWVGSWAPRCTGTCS